MEKNISKLFNGEFLFPFYLVICVIVILLNYICTKAQDKNAAIKIEFHIAETEPGEGLIEFAVNQSGEKFYLHPEILSTNTDIKNTSVEKYNDNFDVLIEFTYDGAKKWAEITGNNIGKRVGILLNDQLVTAPIIRAKIEQGKAKITGPFTEEQAEKIAKGILNKQE